MSILVAMATRLVDPSDMLCAEPVTLLRDYMNDLDGLNTLIPTLADITFKSGQMSHLHNHKAALHLTCL